MKLISLFLVLIGSPLFAHVEDSDPLTYARPGTQFRLNIPEPGFNLKPFQNVQYFWNGKPTFTHSIVDTPSRFNGCYFVLKATDRDRQVRAATRSYVLNTPLELVAVTANAWTHVEIPIHSNVIESIGCASDNLTIGYFRQHFGSYVELILPAPEVIDPIAVE